MVIFNGELERAAGATPNGGRELSEAFRTNGGCGFGSANRALAGQSAE